MCGVFGLVVERDADLSSAMLRTALRTLGELSSARGKDCSGLVFKDDQEATLHVVKGAVAIGDLFRTRSVAQNIDRLLGAFKSQSAAPNPFVVVGHSRLVTNGSQRKEANNQPVVKDGIVGIHNGIIVNEAELWSRHQELRREYDIDTEVMLAVLRAHLSQTGNVATAISRTVGEITGTVAAAFLFEDLNVLAAATNNGSLHRLSHQGFVAFASEAYFLRQLAVTLGFDKGGACDIAQVAPNTGFLVDLQRLRLHEFKFSPATTAPWDPAPLAYRTKVTSVASRKPQGELVLDPAQLAVHPRARLEAAILQFNLDQIQALRRCQRCLLPSTFPFIAYDARGICNYCEHYTLKNQPRPLDELLALVETYRRSDGKQDCIIPFSGGRDSTCTLHLAKRVLNLNPIAFTYDWGMVNDLARRNIARVCGKLGVENILVSADIRWKRDNIRKNVLAWLAKPDLGMVPLFMAGDKFFFYYADKVKKQTGVRLNIWGINPLENTDFKVGFLGVPPDFNKKRIYSLSARRQAQLFFGVGKNVLSNPRYVNRSVLDSVGSFVSRSIVPHRDYYHLFDYYRWDEQEIEDLVRNEYTWETAIDTKTTWRIGDGTAAFYNYIYYTVAGFSEYDTFRSNQIREGMLSRDEGLRLVDDENRPRYASIKWYLDILGLDFDSTIRRINAIPKLYDTSGE